MNMEFPKETEHPPKSETKDKQSRLQKYARQVVIGLVVIVLGGLILVFLLHTMNRDSEVVIPPTEEPGVMGVATDTEATTSTPTGVSTLLPEQIALTPVSSNADWTPVEREINGVEMVLIPSGCFMMGSDDGDWDELPVHEVCIDQPFWLDKYEVTQAQFRRLGGTQANSPEFAGDDRPVERITWFEARDFCQLREARLPTEAEWEYAARGPDNLVYPWGDTWDANNAVHNRSRSQGTANVGSIPAGVSWVGALDMSGNVLEWTSSQLRAYPYDASDGREADTGSRTDLMRTSRGGTWNNVSDDFLRGAFRNRMLPDGWTNILGLRCARYYEQP